MAWGLTHDMHGSQKYGKMLGALAIPLAGMIPVNNDTLFNWLAIHALSRFFLCFPFPVQQTKKNRWLYHCQLANSPYLRVHALSRFSRFPFSSLGKRKRTDDFTPVNWLILLPTEIPEARIMTFNYSSRWAALAQECSTSRSSWT